MDRDQAIKLMQDLLRRVTEKKASDLFITAGFPPAIKIDGEIRPQTERALTVRAVRHPGARHHERPPDQGIRRHQGMQLRDRPAGHRPLPRQRLRAAGPVGCVIRLINAKIPTFEELDLPPVLKEVVLSKRGLVIMVGGTGSGKSTSLAAMVGYRNEKTRGHIVTIEDPVEYVHTHKGCVITHREVGVDTDSWQNALKNTLRQAPDVILIGEIRDRETMEYGIQFSETGHLVLATLHANSSNQALDRIINFFPDERRDQLLMDLSLNIRALISQRLIPREAARRAHRRDGDHAQFAADPGPDLQGQGGRDQGSHVALQAPRHEDLRPVRCSSCTRPASFPTRTRCATRTPRTSCACASSSRASATAGLRTTAAA